MELYKFHLYIRNKDHMLVFKQFQLIFPMEYYIKFVKINNIYFLYQIIII